MPFVLIDKRIVNSHLPVECNELVTCPLIIVNGHLAVSKSGGFLGRQKTLLQSGTAAESGLLRRHKAASFGIAIPLRSG